MDSHCTISDANIKAVIDREFGPRLDTHRNHIGVIENRIQQVKYAMKMVKLRTVQQYYHRDALLLPICDSKVDQQIRLHPAYRKALAEANDTKLIPKPIPTPATSNYLYCKELEDYVRSRFEEKDSKPIKTDRELVTRQIVIGNTSRFHYDKNDDDATSHEWTLYVCGSKQSPSVDFIQKVTLILHPTYIPFDVVHLREAPFVYKCRGWSEFAVQIKILLKNNTREIIHFTHHLHLDDTHTGEEVFGRETLYQIKYYK